MQGIWSSPAKCATCDSEYVRHASGNRHCSDACRFLEIFNGIEKDGNGCMLWPKSVNVESGYGQLSTWHDGKRKILATHRLSYQIARGAIPAGKDVLHKCDVRACINPEHLFIGTAKDNTHDMAKKGRVGVGFRGFKGAARASQAS